MRRFLYILMLLLGGSLVSLPSANADDDNLLPREYQVKAAFLYNFTKFVTWPGTQALATTHVANICIVGENPFGAMLADMFMQASTPQLVLNVKRNVSDSDIPNCHILFISKSEDYRLSSILAMAQAHSALTVSEINGFADEGGIIEMVKVAQSVGLFSKDKINLRINLKTAEAEGLHIDAQLLEIAAEVIK